jgi:hypothetical protein
MVRTEVHAFMICVVIDYAIGVYPYVWRHDYLPSNVLVILQQLQHYTF